MIARSFASSVAALFAVALSRVAWACPACLGADEKNASFLKLGSLFVILPFLVVGLVLYVLRQAPERDAAPVRATLPRG